MAKYLDIFTDYGFKKIFGEEANKKILIDFLNSLLPANTLIKDLTFKNAEKLGITPNDRRAVYDIYCQNERGEKFIVELQKAKQNYFKDRTIYYSTFPISEQARQGNWNYELNAVYCIGILDFTFSDYADESEKREVVHRISLKDQNGKQFYHKLTYIYIEMPNFGKVENELETRLDKWLYFIKNLEDFQAIPHIFKDEVVFIEAMEKAELSKMNQDEMVRYNQSLKVYRDNINTFNYAIEEAVKKGEEIGEKIGIEIGEKIGIEIGEKIGIELGEKKGMEIGEKKGMEIGEKKGMEIGEKIGMKIGEKKGVEIGVEIGEKKGVETGIKIGEANKSKYADEKVKEKAFEMAGNCLKNGMNIPLTAKLTGLTEEEVRNIAI